MSNTEHELQSGISAFEAKDFTGAMRILSPLAEEGIAEAQYRMGMMFQNGLGRVKNDEAGIKWMRAAAEQTPRTVRAVPIGLRRQSQLIERDCGGICSSSR